MNQMTFESPFLWWLSIFVGIIAATILPLIVAYISDRIKPWDIVNDNATFFKLMAVVALTGGGVLLAIGWLIYGIYRLVFHV
jgi:hypothetical protein